MNAADESTTSQHEQAPLPAHPVPVATAHPDLVLAVQALEGVLEAAIDSDVDIDLAADVADIHADLLDVRPSLPPMSAPQRVAATDDEAVALIDQAIAHLRVATLGSSDARETMRAGLAARRLQALIERHQPR